MSDLDDLKSRRAAIEGAQDAAVSAGKRGGLLKTVALVTGAAVTGVGGYALYDGLRSPQEVQAELPTSEAAEFPDDRNAGDNMALPQAPAPVIVERPVPQIVPDSAALARLSELEAELARAQETIAASENETAAERELRLQLERERARRDEEIRSLRSAAASDQRRMEATLATLEKQITRLQDDVESERRASEAAKIEAETEAQRKQSEMQRRLLEIEQDYERRLAAATAVDEGEQERLRQEAERRRLMEERRAAEQARRQARIVSGMLALSNTGSTEAGAAEPRELSANEAFVRRAIADVPVSSSQIIANPQATVLQGTIIQAALEVAIDSSLPGQIRAVISEDVYSMDGSSVLIPAGSKVFGEYSNGIETGQRRILIAWTRIVTTSNRTVNIASYGADSLGRSGTGGAIDTRFAARFGGAALISIIGAAPAIIANNATNDANAQEAIEDVGNDFEGATSTALQEVLSIPPTIYVRQGSQVSIVVDRDLEFS